MDMSTDLHIRSTGRSRGGAGKRLVWVWQLDLQSGRAINMKTPPPARPHGRGVPWCLVCVVATRPASSPGDSRRATRRCRQSSTRRPCPRSGPCRPCCTHPERQWAAPSRGSRRPSRPSSRAREWNAALSPPAMCGPERTCTALPHPERGCRERNRPQPSTSGRA